MRSSRSVDSNSVAHVVENALTWSVGQQLADHQEYISVTVATRSQACQSGSQHSRKKHHSSLFTLEPERIDDCCLF